MVAKSEDEESPLMQQNLGIRGIQYLILFPCTGATCYNHHFDHAIDIFNDGEHGCPLCGVCNVSRVKMRSVPSEAPARCLVYFWTTKPSRL